MKIYTERCEKLGIAVNECVYAKSESLESISRYVIVRFMPKSNSKFCIRPKQGTLYASVLQHPRVPAFTTDGLLDYIVELIVSEDEVMQYYFLNMLSRAQFNLGISTD